VDRTSVPGHLASPLSRPSGTPRQNIRIPDPSDKSLGYYQTSLPGRSGQKPDTRSLDSAKREHLTVRMSYDDFKTCSVFKTLWPGPAACSDLVVTERRTGQLSL
jgi:hypothetical protein